MFTCAWNVTVPTPKTLSLISLLLFFYKWSPGSFGFRPRSWIIWKRVNYCLALRNGIIKTAVLIQLPLIEPFIAPKPWLLNLKWCRRVWRRQLCFQDKSRLCVDILECGCSGGGSVGRCPEPEEQDLSQRPNGSQVGQCSSDQNSSKTTGVVGERRLYGYDFQNQIFSIQFNKNVWKLIVMV